MHSYIYIQLTHSTHNTLASKKSRCENLSRSVLAGYVVFTYREEELGSDEDSVADFDFETHDDHNMMNNSLLQVYHENSAIPAPQVSCDASTDVPATHTCDSESLLHDGFPSSCQNTQGEVGSAGGRHLYGETGVPIGIIDTSVESTFLSHVTASDSHVTASDSHVTVTNHPGDGQVTGSDGQCTTQQQLSVSVCGNREDGKEEQTVGATPEGRRRVRKVTFAPDVMDKQDNTTVKVRLLNLVLDMTCGFSDCGFTNDIHKLLKLLFFCLECVCSTEAATCGGRRR